MYTTAKDRSTTSKVADGVSNAPSNNAESAFQSGITTLDDTVVDLQKAKQSLTDSIDEIIAVCGAFKRTVAIQPHPSQTKRIKQFHMKRCLILAYGEEKFEETVKDARLRINQLAKDLAAAEMGAKTFQRRMLEHKDVKAAYEEDGGITTSRTF